MVLVGPSVRLSVRPSVCLQGIIGYDVTDWL